MTDFNDPGDNPYTLFQSWLNEATQSEINDPNAMNLATVGANGRPSNRMVLLKDFDENGFVFYTNSHSRKGTQLSENNVAALCFHWKSLRKQVRIEGTVTMVTPAEADAYFHSRPRGSQLASSASDQSRPLDSRETFLNRVAALDKQYADKDIIPRPQHWNGYRVTPDYIEFWAEGLYRMHDRFAFTLKNGGDWDVNRLYP